VKLNLSLCTCLLLLTRLAVHAAPILITGTPGDDLLATPTGPSPNLGGLLLTFSELTGFSTFNPSTYASKGVTISSPDGLEVLPFSTQSNPNFLFDESSDGSADIDIALNFGTRAIGVGIADSDDSPNIVIEAYGLGGVSDVLGSFDVTIPETTVNPGNGYFAVEDTSSDIYGLVITAVATDESGLAIADVQVAPEPASFLLLAGALAAFGFGRRLYKKA
jgi:hypothetical protein